MSTNVSAGFPVTMNVPMNTVGWKGNTAPGGALLHTSSL